MKTVLDVHTHTIASGHAFSTLSEMIAEARRQGLQLLGVTEHAPSIPGTCNKIYFRNIHIVPRHYGALRLLMGAEINILNTHGDLDLDDEYMARLELRIAGIHGVCYQSGTAEENTEGLIRVIRDKRIHIISHPGDGTAQLLFEPVVLAAKEAHTLLEINSSSMRPARHFGHARENNLELLRLCKQHDVPVILGSDAHIACDISNYEHAWPLLHETEFPEALIVNTSVERFLSYTGI
ncbi:MAG: phosphatase [Prevotellaceae bacterium]|nr:phosphatase [Prevotellaceae bacterium]